MKDKIISTGLWLVFWFILAVFVSYLFCWSQYLIWDIRDAIGVWAIIVGLRITLID